MVVYCAAGMDSRLDELADRYLVRGPDGAIVCTLCSKVSRSRYSGKEHLEGKHFPTDGAYSCELCSKICNTLNALKCHKKAFHK